MNENRRFIFSFQNGRLVKPVKVFTFIELIDEFIKHPSALGGHPVLEGIEELKKAGFLIEVENGNQRKH